MDRPVLVLALVLLLQSARAATAEPGGLNALILETIRGMPREGGYSVSSAVMPPLRAAFTLGPGGLAIDASQAVPSYCSSATYLVFASVCSQLARNGEIALDPASAAALLVTNQRDGEGVWGRWNANGPGTARFFRELGLGRNFTDWNQARAGDFMKIFWTNEIGQRERGHSVIYLGTERADGVEYVRFWSSNKPLGYGAKRVTRGSIAFAVFSRLEHPENLSRLSRLPARDAYLASMLTVRSNPAEVRARCGIE
jgi:hypothetical protein